MCHFFATHTLPKFEILAKLIFQKVTLQGVALILFKFCLISEAQTHSSKSNSHLIF